MELTVGLPRGQTNCPTSVALDFFRHEIAYDRALETDSLQGLSLIHVRVWERGSLTAFYVEEPLRTFSPNLRLAYFVGAEGPQGSCSCPIEQDWLKCVEASAGEEGANNVVRTCIATLDLSTIPAWEPSPDSKEKRRIADEIRREIEAEYPRAKEIVIRDFNFKDREIMIYRKVPDGDYYSACGFHAMHQPHCEGWHLFGMAPLSTIRKQIFDRPYRLK